MRHGRIWLMIAMLIGISACGSDPETVEAFGLTVTPIAGLSIAPGGSASATIHVTRSTGFTETIAFTVNGVPNGVTLSPTPAPTAGDTSSVGVVASSNTTPGTYTLTIQGAAVGGVAHMVTLQVIITGS